MDISFIHIGWLLLGIFQVAISISFFHNYNMDKDKRKLMFGLAFLALSYSHFYEAFIYLIFNEQIPIIYENVQYWSFYPLIFAVGIAVHQNFLNKIDYNKIFKIFLYLSILLFPLIVFNPIPANPYSGFIAMALGIEIIIMSLLNIRKHKDLYNFFICLAAVCIVMGGIVLQFKEYSSSIIAFFFGGINILIMFWIPKKSFEIEQSNISDFFTVKYQLDKTTTELHDTTERYKRLMETLPEGIIVINRFGRITYVNPALEKLYDIPFSQSKGTSFAKYLTKSSLMTSVKLLNKIKHGKYVEKVELEAVHHDKHIFPIEVWATPFDKEGKYDGIICIIRDITERKQAEEEMTKLATVIRYSSELVNLSTLDGKMIFLNESGSKMLGIAPEQINQFNILQVIPDHLINLVQTELLPALMHGGTWEGDLQYKNIVNGNIVDVHAMTFVVFEPNSKKPLYFANVSIDISNRKKAEEKLRQAYDMMSKMNEELELKVKERTTEIKDLLIQKDEFINQLGHDLKNPLGPLINLLPLLEKQEDDPKKKAMITVMLRNTGYMKNLVTKTLKLARLNSPNTKLSLESYSLKNQLFQIIENNKLQFDEKHMTIINNISAELIVNADKLHFEELFTNLLNNSVKYSNEFGKIIINAEENEGEIQLSIRDNGIGMTREQLSKLFSEFYKADISRHDFDSSGLGMSIAKRIVEKHGGTIWAESEGLGKGSTFYITLPKNHTIHQEREIQEISAQKTNNETYEIHSKIDMIIR